MNAIRRLLLDDRGAVEAPTRRKKKVRAAAHQGVRHFRRDVWWLPSLITVLVLTSFVVYGTWAAFRHSHYFVEPYLSPFYSPCIAAICVEHTFRLLGDWWKFSPALLILPFPLSFRLTCYYYRKAYYRSFWQSPPGCAVAEPHKRYTGETRFPLILQNIHRYAFYAALPFPIILYYDAFQATSFHGSFGIGVGTVVLFLNATLLGIYTLSCHSCRHLCGGHLDSFSRSPLRFRLWKVVSRLNKRHMLWAWISLVWVAFTDLYVYLVSTGRLTDLRII